MYNETAYTHIESACCAIKLNNILFSRHSFECRAVFYSTKATNSCRNLVRDV